jgi:cobalt-zinc-cadmium efflux system outer membrane protein
MVGESAWRFCIARAAYSLLLFVLAGNFGCQSYPSSALQPMAVEGSSSAPRWEELEIEAAKLKHPILKPVPLSWKEGLTPDGASVLAVLLNPNLRAARDERGLADAQILEAGLLPNPEFGTTFESPVGRETQGTVTAFGLQITWEITALISRSARVKASEAKRAAVDSDIAWREWQVAQDAKAAVLNLASLNAQVFLASEMDRRLRENMELVRKAVERGTETEKNLSAAKTASRRAAMKVVDLQRQIEGQRIKLKQLLGLQSGGEIHLKEGIELPIRLEVPPMDELLKGLEERRLDLVGLREALESQNEALHASVLQEFPKIRIGPTIGRDTENVDTVGLAMAIELPIFNRKQGKVALAWSSRQKLTDEYTARIFETRSEIESLLSRIAFLNRQIADAQVAEPDLERLVETYRTAAHMGRADVLSYYLAWNDLANIRMEIEALRGQLAEAEVALETSTGLYTIPASHKNHEKEEGLGR